MNLNNKRVAVISAALLLAAVVIVIALGTKVGALNKQPPVVQVALAQDSSSQSDVMAQGVIVPVASANVSVLPRFEAQVNQVLVQVGDHVRAGQTLAVLDPIYQQDQTLQAQASALAADAHYRLVLHPFRRE